MRLLVTGGAGFIGSHFVKRLAARGDEVVVLDRLTYSGNRANLEGVPHELHHGDIADAEAVAVAGTACEAAVNFAKLLPQTSDPCGRVIYGNQIRSKLNMAVGRIDYQRSEKNSIFGRYLLDSNFSPAPYSLNHNVLSVANGSTGLGIDALTQAFSLGDTYLVSTKVVNSLRLTANRWVGGRTGVEYAGWPDRM